MEDILNFENREQLYKTLVDKFGLIKVEEKYDPEAFGNFFITLSAKEFLLRYVNDRSVLTIEISHLTEPLQWYDLSFVRDFIYNPDNVTADDSVLDNDYRIKELNNFIRKEFDLISDLFNEDNYQNTQQRLDELLKNKYYRDFK